MKIVTQKQGRGRGNRDQSGSKQSVGTKMALFRGIILYIVKY
jgi:hypothetical protein